MENGVGSDRGREARRLLENLRALVRRFAVSERSDVSCCGVTVAQAATLETLLVEGPMRLGDLGTRLGISPSTLTRNLVRLEEKGIVSREADPADARSARASLTVVGRAAARALERQEEAFAREVLDRVPAARRRAVLDGIEALLGAVRAATESCCPGAFDPLMKDFPRAASRPERRRR
jgi:DNA-binding MarR family transcriptional regulator